MADDMVWLELPETGGKQQFPTEAVPAWQARGWMPCDPPREPDTLHDPLPETAGTDPAPDVDMPDEPEPDHAPDLFFESAPAGDTNITEPEE